MKVITGNRLSDGAVVFFNSAGQWVPALEDAVRYADAEAGSALERAQAQVHEIADVYLIDVDDEGQLVGRETLRESIRRAGPTVRRDLGYQAGV
ncbi:DUF2849 domain-containing protein [Hyphococcus sp. DH-69]|uniref:DUF2849 domain-containing protein n=1 Tax=Hyphococcus formosus TaxID=3143534 RepID=UPI00398AE3DF